MLEVSFIYCHGIWILSNVYHGNKTRLHVSSFSHKRWLLTRINFQKTLTPVLRQKDLCSCWYLKYPSDIVPNTPLPGRAMEDWFPKNYDLTLENLSHSIHVQPVYTMTYLLPQITEGVAVKHVSVEKGNIEFLRWLFYPDPPEEDAIGLRYASPILLQINK